MKFSEALSHLKNPDFIPSWLYNILLKGWDNISPSEYAKCYRAISDYTMASNARLRKLYWAINHVKELNIAGDIVECGSARGGSAALMGMAMKQDWEGRKLWLFDTFEGLPKPNSNDPDYETALLYEGLCRGSLEDVTELLKKLQLLQNCTLVKGLFQDTLPQVDIEKISVLHLDGDWYDSVMVCLQHLYDKITPGGIIIIDDYGYWEGARKATDEFIAKRNLHSKIHYTDYSGRFFIKE